MPMCTCTAFWKNQFCIVSCVKPIKKKCINRWQDWRTGGIGQAFIERLPEFCALIMDLNNH